MCRHVLITLLLIECVIVWTVASSVNLVVDGHSNSGQQQGALDEREDGSSYVTTRLEDHRQGQRRRENTNVRDKWQESRDRILKLKELQDKFADVEMMLIDQIGTMKRHFAWKTPSLESSKCKDDHNSGNSEIPEGRTSRTANSIGAGTLYVRWGNTECPVNARKVYEGIVGGAWSVAQGDEIDSQCVPNDPSFPILESNIHPFYPDDETESSLTVAPGDIPYIHHGIPCVLCRVTFRPRVRLLIGKPTCTTSEWTLEYAGALMTSLGSNGNHVDFMCVDKVGNLEQDKESMINTSGNENVGEAQWTCAVCTK